MIHNNDLFLCEETCLGQEEATVDLRSESYISKGDEDEYLHVSLQRESAPSSLASVDDWIKCARLNSVYWILRATERFGFRLQTAYLSVAYIDQFISRRSIVKGKDWAFRLLSLACLCLAAKMEECTVPPLPEIFLVEGTEYKFESKVIRRMELLVLSALEWNMRLVTPFSYIDCFVAKLCSDRLISRSIISRIVEIIMVALRDVNLMSHQPSVIAGAATLVALDSKLTIPELKIKVNAHAIFPSEFMEMGNIVSCYNRMKELPNMENVTIPKCVVSPNFQEVRRRGMGSFESYVISGLSSKRKRLVFKDSDLDYGTPDDKKPR